MTADGSSFDAIVIGSGFGGAIHAHRLAAAGRRVCVLERGKAYAPDDFPRDIKDADRVLWRYPASPAAQGLYDLRFFSGIGAVAASGLGGGSLVYANINIRPDASIFDARWPKGVDGETLAPYYDRVAAMLHVSPLPEHTHLKKAAALDAAVAKLGKTADLFRPDQAVHWGEGEGEEDTDPYGNGALQGRCRLIAECEFGCPHRAKNSLDTNYLALARAHGAKIRVRTVAGQIDPLPGGGYRVWTTDAGTGEKSSVTAACVVISAGTLGTAELLLRCRDEHRSLPALSARLGYRFSGNGDFLGNVMNCADDLEPWRGPDVTSVVRYFDDGKSYFTMATPTFARPVMEALTGMGQRSNPVIRLMAPFIWPWLNTLAPWVLRSGALGFRLPLPWARSADPARTTILFAIGRDSADGRLVLAKRRGGRALDVVWDYGARNARLVESMSAAMRELAGAYGGTFDIAPFWKYFRRIVTVHPLGGCVMAESPDEGVVSPWGEVFGYPGLFVADGSVIPSSIGFHPAMTISAVAERISDAVVAGC
jgi:cholesterol oxidase